jgi:hypothetical protein
LSRQFCKPAPASEKTLPLHLTQESIAANSFSLFSRIGAPYAAGNQEAGTDKEFVESSFYLLVIQEVAPETWRNHVKELEQQLKR